MADIPISQLRHRWLAPISCLAIVTLLASCSAENGEQRRWTEEVLLEDGTTVQIARHVVFDETNALGGGTYNAVESKSTLKFKGELSSLPEWGFPWIALVLYKNTQTSNWTIIATTSSREAWQKGGKPCPPYWQFELLNDAWQQVPLSTEAIGKKANLFYRYWENKVPTHITPIMRAQLQSDPGIVLMYREIVSETSLFQCN